MPNDPGITDCPETTPACIAAALPRGMQAEIQVAFLACALQVVSKRLLNVEPSLVELYPYGWVLTTYGRSTAEALGQRGLPKVIRERRHRSKWNPAWDKQMQDGWDGPHAVSEKEFARRFDVSSAAVYRNARRLGLMARNASSKWLSEWSLQMQEQWGPPHSVPLDEFARRFDVHPNTVRIHAKALGLLHSSDALDQRGKVLAGISAARARGIPFGGCAPFVFANGKDEKAKELLAQGVPTKSVAAMLGVSLSSIYNLMRQNDIKRQNYTKASNRMGKPDVE